MELECLNEEQHWRNVFNKYDIDRDGKLNFVEFRNLIEGHEYKHVLPSYVVEEIFEKADHNKDGTLDFQEFHEMIMKKENHFAFSKLKRLYIQYVKFMVPPQENNMTPTEVYENKFSCWPPPIVMIIISFLDIILFSIDYSLDYNVNIAGGPVATVLIYNPRKRYEIWRYISYMFVHVDWLHLLINVLIQILLGTPLELVHRGSRVLTVYLAGIWAASLGTSVVDPKVYLAGASGGVYSLITAHLATIIMNWKQMSYPFIQFIMFLLVIGIDIRNFIYVWYVDGLDSNVGYMANFSGALAGLLVGITVLRNIRVTRVERVVRRITFVVYIILIGTAIICNIVLPNYFLK